MTTTLVGTPDPEPSATSHEIPLVSTAPTTSSPLGGGLPPAAPVVAGPAFELLTPAQCEAANLNQQPDWVDTFPGTTLDAAIWGQPWNGNAGGGQNDRYDPSHVHVENGSCSLVCRQNPDGSRTSAGIGSYMAKPFIYGLWVVRARFDNPDGGSVDNVLLDWPNTKAGSPGWSVGTEDDWVEANRRWNGLSFGEHVHYGAQNSTANATGPSSFDTSQFHTYYLYRRQGEVAVWADAFGNGAAPLTVVTGPFITSQPKFLVAECLAQGTCTFDKIVLTGAAQYTAA